MSIKKQKKVTVEIIKTKNIIEALAGSLNPDGKIKYVPIEIAREKAGYLLGLKYGLN